MGSELSLKIDRMDRPPYRAQPLRLVGIRQIKNTMAYVAVDIATPNCEPHVEILVEFKSPGEPSGFSVKDTQKLLYNIGTDKCLLGFVVKFGSSKRTIWMAAEATDKQLYAIKRMIKGFIDDNMKNL